LLNLTMAPPWSPMMTCELRRACFFTRQLLYTSCFSKKSYTLHGKNKLHYCKLLT
jgi:hypothetical protein